MRTVTKSDVLMLLRLPLESPLPATLSPGQVAQLQAEEKDSPRLENWGRAVARAISPGARFKLAHRVESVTTRLQQTFRRSSFQYGKGAATRYETVLGPEKERVETFIHIERDAVAAWLQAIEVQPSPHMLVWLKSGASKTITAKPPTHNAPKGDAKTGPSALQGRAMKRKACK